jgi:DNA-binding transcriptional MerR regulator
VATSFAQQYADCLIREESGSKMAPRALFSIGTVSRMLGVSVGTLRAWEQRYGLVQPERSPGGQRLFSREQVEYLRVVKEQVEAGLTPADAHRVLSEQLDEPGMRPHTGRGEQTGTWRNDAGASWPGESDQPPGAARSDDA